MLCRFIVLAITILSILPSIDRPTLAQAAKLYPVDDAYRDPSFFLFRARLFQAIQQRDTAYVTGILSPSVKNSFGGSGGIAEFKQFWKLERADSKFWKTVNEVLALGGSFQTAHTFMAPYTYSKFPDEFDAFEHGVVVGENVIVRKQPALDSAVIATLSYDIVRVADWKPKQDELKNQGRVNVVLKDGSKGYISEDYIRSPIDYRAIFEKRDERWQLAALVTGD